ncbi:MAG TPA: asparagine synthase-related protein, partial [Methyloceanibacter sp.]|nr:asparagine synthase-related protein [Methyloceanibacter sp.]
MRHEQSARQRRSRPHRGTGSGSRRCWPWPIHPRWKVHGFAEDKYLLRQAAARILPAEIAQRRKAMFRAPLAESFLAHPPSFVRDLISPQSLARTG